MRLDVTDLSFGQDLLLIQFEGRADFTSDGGRLLAGVQRVLFWKFSCQLLKQVTQCYTLNPAVCVQNLQQHFM